MQQTWNKAGLGSRIPKMPWYNKIQNIQQSDQSRHSNEDEIHGEYYSQISPELMLRVYEKFKLDFDLFEYDLIDILKLGGHCSGEQCINLWNQIHLS